VKASFAALSRRHRRIRYSTDHGRTWSAPLRVTSDHDNTMHNVEVVGAGPGVADVAWQADNSALGYATYLRPFSITKGWLHVKPRASRSPPGHPAEGEITTDLR
jgi:hypothetical protein